MLKGSTLNPSAAQAARYNEQLQKLIDRMADDVEKEIRKLFEGETAETYYAADASIASQARILTNSFMATFAAMFNRRAKKLSEQMVKGAAETSKTALHSSLKEMSGGLSLNTGLVPGDLEEALSASVTENVALIKSIPQEYLAKVQGAVMRSIQPGGNGLKDLVPFLQSQKQITKRHARNVALDQTRKAFNSANTERMKSLGVKKFEWIHSGGGVHPRKEHVEMSGNIYSFDDLPVIGVMYGSEVRGIPGQLPNCRCTMRPVIEFDSDG
jgi:SPP1 gp7 family putative phage head morphogenesis protein